MPHNDDTVLVTASRDGQVRCHTLTSTGELHHSSTVGNHSDSAHKVRTWTLHFAVVSGNEILVCQSTL